MLGVSISTLRRWDAAGRLVAERTPSGRRMYNIAAVASLNPLKVSQNVAEPPTIAHARVPSRDQKADLVRQVKVLEMDCASHGGKYRVIQDLGSGMNHSKQGLRELLGLIPERGIGRLVVTHGERVFKCDECGFVCPRDHNAAISLKNLAAGSAVSARGEFSVPASGHSSERKHPLRSRKKTSDLAAGWGKLHSHQ